MTDKIAWFEEVLNLEPNSKLFFPLAQAYVRENRHADAVKILRKGLNFHPEHLEARLLLIESLTLQEGERGSEFERMSPEISSLSATLSAYPSFWKHWAALNRSAGRNDLALTLDMLAVQLERAGFSWGDVLENGLRAMTASSHRGIALDGLVPEPDSTATQIQDSSPRTFFPASVEPPADNLPEGAFLDPTSAEATDVTSNDTLTGVSNSSDFTASVPVSGSAGPDRETTLDTIPGEHILDDSPHPGETFFDAPAVAEMDSSDIDEEIFRDQPASLEKSNSDLTEGERRYYETKTYADLLAEQGENAEALELYNKLLLSSPDDDQQLDLRSRIQALKIRIGDSPDDQRNGDASPAENPAPFPDDREELQAESVAAPSLHAKAAATAQTLTRLAERLESRARR